MTRHAPLEPACPGSDPGRQVAQLREVLRLVEGIAGIGRGESGDALLDEGAVVSGAYDRAFPIVQRRFDALVAETADWAAAGVEALLAGGAGAPSPAAAARLAAQLEAALEEIRALLRQPA